VKVDAATRSKLVEIGEAIRTARERADVSQAALAAKVGMQRENMIRLEKGRVNLTVETLMRIASGLGLDLNVKLTRSRPKGT
jgi:transcriptional regulator with XRE-family HTH domain